MYARLTWQPADTAGPETLTVDLPAHRIAEMRQLIGTSEWVRSEAIVWILCRTRPDAPMGRRSFRLARITDVEAYDGPAYR